MRHLGGNGVLPVGISCGVAACSEGVDRPASLLRAADFAQYRAKHAGPAVPVEVAEPGAPAVPPGPDAGRSYRDLPASDLPRERPARGR